MTAFYSSTEEIAANALQICDDLRSQYLPGMFHGLARECATHPARMAQVLMCLAVWVDYEAPALVAGCACTGGTGCAHGGIRRRRRPSPLHSAGG